MQVSLPRVVTAPVPAGLPRAKTALPLNDPGHVGTALRRNGLKQVRIVLLPDARLHARIVLAPNAPPRGRTVPQRGAMIGDPEPGPARVRGPRLLELAAARVSTYVFVAVVRSASAADVSLSTAVVVPIARTGVDVGGMWFQSYRSAP